MYAYPSLIAAAKGYALNFRACSGATVADVTNSQLSALSAANAYVTISVGGNDAGFASVLTTCAQPSWLSNCTGAVDGAQGYITNTLPGSLATLYASIRAKAPNAKVVVVGYPRIFNGTDCNLLTWFSGSEMTRLNQTADQLDGTIAAAAASAGFGFVNPVPAFVGHAVCDRTEWINGLSSPITESFHPNRSGQASGYTPLVSPALVGAPVAVTPAVLQKAAASADRLADAAAVLRRRGRDDHPEAVRGAGPPDQPSVTGGAQPGRGMRQNGCPAGSAHTEPSGLASRRAPRAATCRSAAGTSSTMTSWWICCGRVGSPHTGAWWSGASWNAIPEWSSCGATTTKSSDAYVMGWPRTADQNRARPIGSGVS